MIGATLVHGQRDAAPTWSGLGDGGGDVGTATPQAIGATVPFGKVINRFSEWFASISLLRGCR